MSKKMLIVGLAAAFLFLRWYRLPERLNFSMDQGMFLLRAREVWEKKEATLLGPTASIKVDGRQVFQGSLIYYSLILVMAATAWDPLWASGFLGLLGLLGMYFSYKTAGKLFGVRAGIVAAWLYTFWPTVIRFGNFLWNPNFLLILTPMYLYCGVLGWWMVAGVLGGASLQFHFQFGLIILTTIGLLAWKKNWRNLLKYLAGLVVGYSPLIVFDLRNRFYNLSTAIDWAVSGSREKLELQEYYWLGVTVVVLILLSGVMVKNLKKIIAVTVLAGLAVYSTWDIVTQNHPWGMPENWNYLDLQKTAQLVGGGTRENYNVVNLLDGDTRFYTLRYLMKMRRQEPLGIENYVGAKELWVISNLDQKGVENYPVWEIQSFGAKRLKEKWQINRVVSLYRFEKG